ncbi:MAG: gamma-glutamylcyclotransferase, partial [Gammaproteobacteria bacterium]|nr:gamma-glutamylcyclotransferase [Gammaproteobacteria bacterium]NIR99054.1 gamma-glutamylcyclotransferase [Gammaproteobacteria bacterium]NIT64680.1 gamma-glutamylcyclotransferase [Gammaproteobacteria bacterium]NIV21641.1 gamma-glutamylcyclotransferase [Gammaproteobacteria bacterium]NIY33260.1 gamma-glutamylcyclotransferase [Gammaproteobacteria bacterium]
MTDTILYFAYGSNLHPPQMHERCPTCTVLQPATLADYRLVFCGHSEHWGGGVASVVTAPGARVEGLL